MKPETQNKIYQTLRIAMAMCFIGHGAFGIITKPVWCHYFAVFGIANDLAYRLMPPVGILDIVLGLIILIYPVRAVVCWLVLWGGITAALRPLSGEPLAECIERAGNYGAPIAMLVMAGLSGRNLLSPVKPDLQQDEQTTRRLVLCLRVVVFLLIAGHGWLNLLEKKSLLEQYASLGFANPSRIAFSLGVLEIIAALWILIRPFAGLLAILFIWKMASEVLYPHYGLLEWIERGGSYGCVLALYYAVRTSSPVVIWRVWPSGNYRLPLFGKAEFNK